MYALGIWKVCMGVSSGIEAFGRTKAPVEISVNSGLYGETGLDANTTFAKCVGTPTAGGFPIISCV